MGPPSRVADGAPPCPQAVGVVVRGSVDLLLQEL